MLHVSAYPLIRLSLAGALGGYPLARLLACPGYPLIRAIRNFRLSRLSAYPLIRPSAFPLIRLSAYPRIRLSAYPLIHLSAYPLIRLSDVQTTGEAAARLLGDSLAPVRAVRRRRQGIAEVPRLLSSG